MAPALAPTSIMPSDLPETFFSGIKDPAPPGRRDPSAPITQPAAAMKALVLYDAIIDDILAHPGDSFAETARRLGKSGTTISMVARSDFFRARWIQRREKYNEDFNFRLQSKMGAVLEKSLATTLEVLEKKGDNVPLATLTEINTSILDRLGYAPASRGGGPAVVIQNNATANSAPQNAQASPEGLSRARQFLEILQQRNAAEGPSPGNGASLSRDGDTSGPVVEGEAHRVEP